MPLTFVTGNFSTLPGQKTVSFRTEGPEGKTVLAEGPKNQGII